MRKVLSVTVSLLLVLVIIGCTTVGSASATANPDPLASLNSEKLSINMDNLDDFIGRTDVQLVDLRDFQDKFTVGYIRGFEFIPFFQFLENRFVTRTKEVMQEWNPTKATIYTSFPLENYFDKDKSILLMCSSGTRAGYIKYILERKGYRAYKVGGYDNYEGKYKVIGDPDFQL
jgi:rhodanese-related sulfurtransferase